MVKAGFAPMLFRLNQLPSTEGNPESNEYWKRMYQMKSKIKEGKGKGSNKHPSGGKGRMGSAIITNRRPECLPKDAIRRPGKIKRTTRG